MLPRPLVLCVCVVVVVVASMILPILDPSTRPVGGRLLLTCRMFGRTCIWVCWTRTASVWTYVVRCRRRLGGGSGSIVLVLSAAWSRIRLVLVGCVSVR